MNNTQSLIITIIGWVYFTAWSVSFYGQIYTNFKIKSVQGMNFDFIGLNLTGFLLYGIYSSYGYFIDSIQTGQVDLNDIMFVYHALFATGLTILQILIYPHKKNKIHSYTIAFLIFVWASCIIYAVITAKHEIIFQNNKIGVISLMGYFKVIISTLKYLPQFYWNYKRKSTKGWSIFNVLMDLTGGIFSFSQMGLQMLFVQGVSLNVIKITLGGMSIVYACGFIIQHYCLYGDDQQQQINLSKQTYIILRSKSQKQISQQNITD